MILAYKRYLRRDILSTGAYLNIPPFFDTSQLTKEYLYLTESIARAHNCIMLNEPYVELKFTGFQITFLHHYYLLPHIDCIFKVFYALSNLQYPLIIKVNFYNKKLS